MKDNFNDIKDFEKGLIKILNNYASSKLSEMLEFVVQTHNIQPLLEIIKIIDKNKF